MARIRSVHPKICESEDLIDLPAEVERTFVRLWTHCDDEGRAKDNPRLIKAAIYPLLDDMTAAIVDEHLDELAKRGLVVRYEVEGVRYLAVPKWSKYQHPQKKRQSDLPQPPPTSTGDVRDEARSDTRTVANESGPGVGVGVGVGVGEGEGELAPPSVESLALVPLEESAPTSSDAEVLSLPERTTGRKPDLLWDAVMQVCGIDCSTIPPSARGGYGKAVKDIRSVGAEPVDVHERANNYRLHMPHATLTPSALAKHWALCANPPRAQIRGADVLERFVRDGQR